MVAELPNAGGVVLATDFASLSRALEKRRESRYTRLVQPAECIPDNECVTDGRAICKSRLERPHPRDTLDVATW